MKRTGLVGLCGALALLPACLQAQPVEPKQVGQVDAKALADACHVNRSAAGTRGKPTHADYKAAACLLKKFKNVDYPNTKTGTIGDQTYLQKAD